MSEYVNHDFSWCLSHILLRHISKMDSSLPSHYFPQTAYCESQPANWQLRAPCMIQMSMKNFTLKYTSTYWNKARKFFLLLQHLLQIKRNNNITILILTQCAHQIEINGRLHKFLLYNASTLLTCAKV